MSQNGTIRRMHDRRRLWHKHRKAGFSRPMGIRFVKHLLMAAVTSCPPRNGGPPICLRRWAWVSRRVLELLVRLAGCWSDGVRPDEAQGIIVAA